MRRDQNYLVDMGFLNNTLHKHHTLSVESWYYSQVTRLRSIFITWRAIRSGYVYLEPELQCHRKSGGSVRHTSQRGEEIWWKMRKCCQNYNKLVIG